MKTAVRRTVMLFLAVLLVIFAAAALGETEYTFEADYAALGNYTGAGGDLVVPGEWEGQRVLRTGSLLYYGNDTVTSLEFQAPLEVLGTGAVENMQNLKRVVLPDTLKVICVGNFQGLPMLEEVTIPASVRYIDEGCFTFCDALKSVIFLGEVPEIRGLSFETLSGTTVYVPSDLVDAYTRVLPANVTVASSGIRAVHVDMTADPADIVFDAASQTITAYTGMNSVVALPSEIDGVPVLHIGERALYQNQHMDVLILPEGLETIGEEAFASSRFLTWAQCPDTVREIGARAFAGGYNGSAIEWSTALETIGDGAFQYTSLSNELELPYGLKWIGDEAFLGINWAEVSIPETVEHIGNRAFADSYVTYAAIDAYDLEGIGENVFENCTSLTDLDLPWDADLETLRTFEAYMAPQAPECRVWINNPPDVSYVEGDYKYEEDGEGGCYLSYYNGEQEGVMLHYNVWFEENGEDVLRPVKGVGDGAFKGNSQVRRFRVTHSFDMTSIGAEAFADSVLEEIDLFYSTETIGEGAFRNCRGLKEIVLPESLAYIGPGAFDGCDGLEKVTVLCDASVIPADAFVNCSALMANPDGLIFRADADPAAVQAVYRMMGVPVDSPEGMENPEGVENPEGGDGLAYAGTWNLTEVIIGGAHYSAETLNLSTQIELRADMTATAWDEEGTRESVWTYEDGVITVDGDTLVSQEDGTLQAGTAGIIMIFEKLQAEEPEVPEETLRYSGSWTATQVAMGGQTYAADFLNMEMHMELRTDGTCTVKTAEGEVEEGVWSITEDGIDVAGDLLLPQEDGTLQAKTGIIVVTFVKENAAEAVREPAPTPEPVEVTEAPIPEATKKPEKEKTGLSSLNKSRVVVESNYICTSAIVDGIEISAENLGGEYSVNFHLGGKLDFVMAGESIQGLTWDIDGGDFVSDYFGVAELRFVPVDGKLELDLFGAMTLVFELGKIAPIKVW